MSYHTYRINDDFGGFELSADLSDASAPVYWICDEGVSHSTPLQTADGCHDAAKLARLVCDHVCDECGEEYSDSVQLA